MKERCLTLLLLSQLLYSGAQDSSARGFYHIHNSIRQDSGTIYALIAGVSQYTDTRMPQLHYADSDAIYFYNVIRAGALGKTDSPNIQLLLNKEVTEANFRQRVACISRKLKPGDKVYIFMAGHGDAKNPRLVYFLSSQTPRVEDANEYKAVECIRMADVVDNISDMLVSQNVKIFLITDFCRSNELLGKDSLAAFLFANNNVMQTEVPRLVRMVSCSSNHLAEEDDPANKKWNGHGVFTYYLVNGLLGMADKDGTGYVTLHDLNRYTTDNVEHDTKSTTDPKLMQSPWFSTSDQEQVIAKVSPKLEQAFATAGGGTHTPDNALIAYNGSFNESSRSVSNLIADTALYFKFINAVKEGNLIAPSGKNAVDYLNKLLEKINDENTRADLTDMLVAALLNNGQTPINEYSKDILDPNRYDYKYFFGASQYFNAALPYLNENKKLYDRTNASRLFLAARAMYNSKERKDWARGLDLADSALSIAQWAYIYHTKGLLESKLGNSAGAQQNEFLALQTAPNWGCLLNSIGTNFNDEGKYDSAAVYYRRAIQADPKNFESYDNMGANFKAQQQYDSANFYYRKAVEASPKYAGAYWDLSENFRAIGKFDSARTYCLYALQIKPDYYDAMNSLGANYASLQQNDSAAYYYKKAIQINADSFEAYYNLACIYSIKKDAAEAMKYFKQAVKKGYRNWVAINGDTDLDSIREQVNAFIKDQKSGK